MLSVTYQGFVVGKGSLRLG